MNLKTDPILISKFKLLLLIFIIVRNSSVMFLTLNDDSYATYTTLYTYNITLRKEDLKEWDRQTYQHLERDKCFRVTLVVPSAAKFQNSINPVTEVEADPTYLTSVGLDLFKRNVLQLIWGH